MKKISRAIKKQEIYCFNQLFNFNCKLDRKTRDDCSAGAENCFDIKRPRGTKPRRSNDI